MTVKRFTDQEIVAAYQEHGSFRLAGAALGYDYSAFARRYKRIIAKTDLDPAIASAMEQVGTNLVPSGVWIKTQNKEGVNVSGYFKPQAKAIVDQAIEIQEAFEGWQPPSMPSIIRPICNDDLLTVYPVLDWHIGLHAWGAETGGIDWDLKEAKRVYPEVFADLIDQTPNSGRALFLGLGDLLHADNVKGMTEQSGNVLDVDSRYAKCQEACTHMILDCINALRSKHTHVDVVFKKGNHDETYTHGLRTAMGLVMRGQSNVTVCPSPSPHYWGEFGCNFIAGSHGDKIKLAGFASAMANVRPDIWGRTTTRHAHTGHIHHERAIEKDGAVVHSHRAPVAQDVYHAEKAYTGLRSMVAYQYHVSRGSRGHFQSEIKI